MSIEIPTLNFIPLIPSLIVIGTGVLVLLFDLLVTDKRLLGYLGLAGVVAAAITSLFLLSGTPIPFQDMAIGDGHAFVFNLVFLVTAALSLLVAIDYLEFKGLQRGEYYALLLFSVSGMMMMAAATDLIIVYLGMETMSVALYILTGFNRRQITSVEAAVKYFIMGAFASAFFLYGVALIYGATGTTNLDQIGIWLSGHGIFRDMMALAGLALMLVGFGFKIAAVPFQWWTPDVYQGAPTSVTAFMSVGAKAAGFAALTRVLQSAFSPIFTADWMIATAILATLTMTVGNLAALAQKDLKRMLGYSSIAHAGYILVGVAAANETGMRGVLFYLLTYTFMSVGAFAVACVVERREGFSTVLSDYAGLSQREPLLAAAMTVFMLSLTGIPPFVGFWGKLYVFQAAVEANMSWLAILGVINSAISLFYYLGVVVQMYMRHPAPVPPSSAARPANTLAHRCPGRPFIPGRGAISVAILLAAVATVALGIWPGAIINLVMWVPFG